MTYEYYISNERGRFKESNAIKISHIALIVYELWVIKYAKVPNCSPAALRKNSTKSCRTTVLQSCSTWMFFSKCCRTTGSTVVLHDLCFFAKCCRTTVLYLVKKTLVFLQWVHSYSQGALVVFWQCFTLVMGYDSDAHEKIQVFLRQTTSHWPVPLP